MFLRVVFPALFGFVPAVALAGGIYWTDRGASQLKRMNFDGSNLQTITLFGAVSAPGSNIRGLAVDNVGNRLFWADNGADRLLRANLDGTGSLVIHSITGGNSFPADVRLDLAGGLFYWCDQQRNRIQRSTLDGASVTDIITNAATAGGPYFMDLDVPQGKIYWGDFGGGSIFRANLDGSARETLLTGNNMTRGVRIDPRERMLYWINRDDKKVHRCPLSAFNSPLSQLPLPLTHPAVQTLYQGLDTPHGLTLDVPARKIYWADTGTNPGNGTGGQSICRGDFDGSTPLEILATGSEPWDVDLDLRCASYTEWVQRCFRRDAPAAQTAPEADPDSDGVPNAVEYAFDLSPMFADRAEWKATLAVLSPQPAASVPELEFHRRAGSSDLRYEVQVSTNLVDWTASEIAEPQLEPLQDGLESVRVRTVYSVAARSNQFVRVQVNYGVR